MISWILDNLSTIIVALIILIIVIIIIKNQIKSRHTCGCSGCEGCSMARNCHSKEKE